MGGTRPPKWGGYFGGLGRDIFKISPPNGVFWWFGGDGPFCWENVEIFGGDGPFLLGNCGFFGGDTRFWRGYLPFPATVLGRNLSSLPKSEGWGDYYFPSKRGRDDWGGRVSRWGGYFFARPPHLGGGDMINYG